MIPLPQRPIAGLGTLPWLSLGFLAVTLALLLGWQQPGEEDERQLRQWYQQSGLQALEQPAYLSWLRLHGRLREARALEQARPDEQGLYPARHFHQLALDPRFTAYNRAALRGEQTPYWQDDALRRWQTLRETFDARATGLPVLAGLDPASARPASLLTLHFTSTGALGWLLCALVLLPFAWAVEGTLGWRRMLLLWPLATVLAGAISTMLLRQQHLFLLGGQIAVSTAIGMYLGLLGHQRLRFLLPARNHTPEWPAWVIAPLWLLLPLTTPMLGQPWWTSLAGLLCGAALVQLARIPDTAALEQEDETEHGADQDSLRQHLTSGWAALGTLQCREAEQHFLAAVRLAPTHFNALCGLYQVRKLRPGEVDFIATANRLLTLPLSDEGERRQQHAIWREALTLCPDTLRLNAASRLQLARQFAHIDALDDAESLLAELGTDSNPHALASVCRALGEGHARRGNHNKARHYLARGEALLSDSGPAPADHSITGAA